MPSDRRDHTASHASACPVGVREVLTPSSEGEVSLGTILLRLEQLRRHLSLEVCGLPGAYAGHDAVVWTTRNAAIRGPVELSARASGRMPRSHTIEFEARLLGDHQVDSKEGLIMRGHGRTLQIPVIDSQRCAATQSE